MDDTRQTRAERGTAWLLTAGAIGAIVGMGLHPIGGLDPRGSSPEALRSKAMTSAVVHAVVIASLVLQAAGALGVHRRMRSRRALADLGLVAFLFASVNGALAATTNGLSAPRLLGLMQEGGSGTAEALRVSWRLSHEVAGVQTIVLLAGTTLAALCWGLALLREAPKLGALGALVGSVGLLCTALGGFRPEVGPLLVYVVLMQVWLLALACWSRAAPAG